MSDRPWFDPRTAPPEPPGAGQPLWGPQPVDPPGEARTAVDRMIEGSADAPWLLQVLPGRQFEIECSVRPNWVRRVLQRVLLGWRYERKAPWSPAPPTTPDGTSPAGPPP